jgi:ankyrin repeat protein
MKKEEYPSQTTLMYIVIADNDEQTVKLLLSAGVSLDQPCNSAMPLLCVVGQTGNMKIAKLLLDSSAEINAWMEKPLFAAATKGLMGLVKFLLERSAIPDAAKPDQDSTSHSNGHNPSRDYGNTHWYWCRRKRNEYHRRDFANDSSWDGMHSDSLNATWKGCENRSCEPEGFMALKIAQRRKHKAIIRELVTAGAKL